MQQLAKQTLPPTITTSFQGTAQIFQSSLQNLTLLLLVAVMVIYLVLGILYESFIHPFTILSGLPSAGLGALLTLLLVWPRAGRVCLCRFDHADRHRRKERDHDDRLCADVRKEKQGSRRRKRSSKPV